MDPNLFRGFLPRASGELNDAFRRIEEENRAEREQARVKRRKRRDRWWAAAKARISDEQGKAKP